MNEEKRSTFKALFSEYCRKEINAGRCEADTCEFCPVSAAYDKIFSKSSEEDLADEAEHIRFASIIPGEVGESIDRYFDEQGWALQRRSDGDEFGYQVYFGAGVQVDNHFEYGFPHLYDEEQLLLFAKDFYQRITSDAQTTEPGQTRNWMFEKLIPHIGHDVVCVCYGDPDDPNDVCIECETCNCVLVSAETFGKDEADGSEGWHGEENSL